MIHFFSFFFGKKRSSVLYTGLISFWYEIYRGFVCLDFIHLSNLLFLIVTIL